MLTKYNRCNFLLRADCMNETGFTSDSLKWASSENIFQYFLNLSRPKKNWKWIKNRILFYFRSLVLLWNIFQCIIFIYFYPVPVWPQTSITTLDVQSFYGLLGWTDMVCISEPVHLGEHVWTHIIQIFIFNGIYHFTKQRKQTLLFLVQSGSELIFLQSTP